MTETLPDMRSTTEVDEGPELVPVRTTASPEELEIARELVASARPVGWR